MITRAARIALHLELLDEAVFKTGHSLTQHDFQHYCAWSNSLVRLLARLALEAPSAGQTLDPIARINDYLASHRDEERNAR
jgi:hypothetical protein